MPVPGFLASIADKAQTAINSTPLGAHLPSHNRPNSPDATSQVPANQAAAQGGNRSHALENITHQIRAFGQQYHPSTTAAQKIITAEKGVALDFDTVARDSKAQSKELYTWGQNDAEDLKDVTDRLAYLNFVQGSLAGSLAQKLDSARSPLKALRDAETALAPRRNVRTNLQNQLARLEHEQQKSQEKKLLEVKEQLRKAELDDAPQEREIEILKRKAIRESEKIKWEAIREYGEKLVLLSQAATPIIAALPAVPPTPETPYTGARATGAARASLQRALDNYKTGHINLPPQLAYSELSRSDTQSFGESHASELSNINATQSTLHSNTPPSQYPSVQDSPTLQGTIHPPRRASSPLDPSVLNNSPAPLPALTSPPTAVHPPEPTRTTPTVSTITPTVAETGIPVSAGADGPGPTSGSLHNIHSSPLTGGASVSVPSAAPHNYESAELEKQRLKAAYSQPISPLPEGAAPLAGPPFNVPPNKHESAEEEKKRLEREERERLLKGESTEQRRKDGKDDELPPYQDL